MNPSGAKGLTPPGLTWPGLIWDNGTPAAARYGDVYYTRGDGLAEKRHVFLAGCGLPDAWRGRSAFTVCELGFGTGLTFLATCRLWAETAAPGARLHYLAVEGHPLSADELRQSLAPWPELAQEAGALLRVYPAPAAGFQRVYPHRTVTLTLLCGDAATVLAQTAAQVDAWYLDGFAPRKNPEMWTPAVLREVARLSRPHARLATYTAAGQVRRELLDAGFAVEVTPGFGRKREMTRGRYAGAIHKSPAPWFAPAEPRTGGHAAIIGGGIAGAAAAGALARRGWSCTVIEQRASLALGASGTPAGVVMPRLTAGPSLDGRVHASAWRHAVRHWAGQPFYTPCGVLQLATDVAEEERLAAIAESGDLGSQALAFLPADAASAMAGCAVPYRALRFAEGGRMDAAGYCAAEAATADIIAGRRATALQRAGELWRVTEGGATLCDADIVIFANAGGIGAFPQNAWLPLTARQGQITAAAATSASARLRCVLAYGGTLTPAEDGLHHVGATFNPARAGADDETVDDDDLRNLAALARVLPDLARGLKPAGAWAGVRWTTPDHLPVVGPLVDAAAFKQAYAPLRHGQHWVDYPAATYEPGLYTLAGFGSHGLALAPLCAELLACHITGDPWPLEQNLVAALHPSRFLLRDLKRPK